MTNKGSCTAWTITSCPTVSSTPSDETSLIAKRKAQQAWIQHLWIDVLETQTISNPNESDTPIIDTETTAKAKAKAILNKAKQELQEVSPTDYEMIELSHASTMVMSNGDANSRIPTSIEVSVSDSRLYPILPSAFCE